MSETLAVRLHVEATLEIQVTETIDKAEYEEWLGDDDDTPQARSLFVGSDRYFDADIYARRTSWADWDCTYVEVRHNQAAEATR